MRNILRFVGVFLGALVVQMPAAGAAEAQGNSAGHLKTLEIEPGKIEFKGDFSVNSLISLRDAPPEQTPAILAAQGSDIDKISPPDLIIRGWRLMPQDRKAGYYYIWLGILRMDYDGLQCADDGSAREGGNAFGTFWLAGAHGVYDDPATELAVIREIGSDRRVFSSRVSASYLCAGSMEQYIIDDRNQQSVPVSRWHVREDVRARAQEDIRKMVSDFAETDEKALRSKSK